jgi:hypothetical protein
MAVQTAGLGGEVFNDLNQNGINNAGDPGIAGATVNLLDSNGNLLGTTTTDSNGNYNFGPLMVGTYEVQYNIPSNYTGISPFQQGTDPTVWSNANPNNNLISNPIPLSGGQVNNTIDAGFYVNGIDPHVDPSKSYCYVTPSCAKTTGGSVSADVDFTVKKGEVDITLSNLLQNPTSDAQLISGLTFNISGATGSSFLPTTNSGNVSTISSGGKYTAGKSDPLTQWKASHSGTKVSLTALTGRKPTGLIIGPDSAGGFINQGTYNKANASIIQHNPVVLGSATYKILIPGVTDTSTLSNVTFQFGTSACGNLVNGILQSNTNC